MIGVVIGTGDWSQVAHAAAYRMWKMTGLGMSVITEKDPQFEHPSWQKCTIFDRPELESEDAFLLFDADIVCVRPWDPEKLFKDLGRAFCAVPDVATDSVYDECASLNIPFPNYYVNGGLLMFGREHHKVWEFVRRKHPKCGRWLEQGALNLALMHTGVEVCRLPKWFNVVTYRGDVEDYHGGHMREKAINIHLTSLNGPRELREMQEFYGIYSSPREQTAVA